MRKTNKGRKDGGTKEYLDKMIASKGNPSRTTTSIQRKPMWLNESRKERR